MNTETNECSLEEKTVENVPITPKQYEDVLEIQHTILSMIAQREEHHKILDRLCVMAEALLPNSVASIMLKDPQTGLLDLKYAPSIPKESWHYLENLKPGPTGGSCGNAVYKEEPQYVINTFEDQRWLDLRHVAHAFNLCSCWSMPIKDAEGNTIGSFALSSFEHRSPSRFHKMLLATGANIASIVLKSVNRESRLNVLQEAMQHANEGIIFTDADNRIVEVNKTFEKLYGYTLDEVKGQNPKILSSGLQTKQFYEQMWKDINETGHWSGEIINKTKNGERIEQWMSINVIEDDEMPARYFAIFTDLRELKKAEELNKYLIYHDQATGLFNKFKLEEILQESEEYTLIHTDINNFSYINMAYGFEFGDNLLKEVAETLSSQFDAEGAFRINSDEFALLYPMDVDPLATVMDMQRYFYDNPFIIDGIVMNVSLNYGVASGGENLLENAAFALKLSKEQGKNRWHIFDKEQDQPSKEEKNRFIEANALVYRAMEEHLFATYFQGIRNNSTGEIEKFEVLLRIEEDGEVVSPFVFLDAAKLSGMLPEITKRVIDKSFQIMQNRSEAFSINITEDDLHQGYLVEYLANQMQKYGIDAKRIVLEILEGVSVSGKKNHIKQLKALKQMGIKLAIDDFGAEYSNFERLLELDIDFLKIDAKYIKNIDTDEKSYEIVKAISAFAKKLDIECVAEFVHSEAVQRKVEELGIEYSQGFYFDEPHKLI